METGAVETLWQEMRAKVFLRAQPLMDTKLESGRICMLILKEMEMGLKTVGDGLRRHEESDVMLGFLENKPKGVEMVVIVAILG